MYQRIGKKAFVKKDLVNTQLLLESLGNPETKYPCIHVAGTNGKGSVSHMLAACYQAKGLKVGLYTSPHYSDFRERIKINGEMVGKREVVNFVARVRDAMLEIKPSFFEMTVAMAFDAFDKAEVDIAIIETGLGGRLDSTNVITPILSVITNISLDHMDMLGDTIPKIAFEKAGIIKTNVPVVVGEWERESAAVFNKKAKEKSSSISYASEQVKCSAAVSDLKESRFNVQMKHSETVHELVLPNSGPFQGKNLATTIWALEVAGKHNPEFVVTPKQRSTALKNLTKLTAYQGRWQLLGEAPLMITDSAHNEAGLAMVVDQLSQYKTGKLHIVLGMVREKDVDAALQHFPKDATYYFCKPNVPRGMEAEVLRQRAHALGFNGRGYTTVRRAVAAAKRKAHTSDLIFIGGSSFVVAEVI